MKLKFTEQDLKKYGSTYTKGLKYFENNAVGDIEMAIDKYVAPVYGSMVYQVEYSPFDNEFSCNCPVNGFCKHLVAFGLKLLKEVDKLPGVENFDAWYESIDDKTKLSFLKMIISKDNKFKSKFQKYVKVTDMPKKKIDIQNLAAEVFKKIDALSWEEALESYSPFDHYMEEYELVDALVESTL